MKRKFTLLLAFAAFIMSFGVTAQTLTDIDLSGLTDDTLGDTIAGVLQDSHIILKAGATYTFDGGPSVAHNVHIDGGTGAMPTININAINVVSGGALDLIKISNCIINGDVTADYIVNIDQACSVTDIIVEGCNITGLRGVMRIKNAEIVTVSNVKFSNCTIDNVGGYGFIDHDNANAKISNVTIENCTVTNNIETMFKLHKAAIDLESITLSGCTFNNNLNSGEYIIDMKGADGVVYNYTNGVMVKNCIFGKTLVANNKALIRVGDGTTVTYTNVYKTTEDADMSMLQIEAEGITTYASNSDALFTDAATGNYAIKDKAFAGISTAGDPRWAGASAVEIVELTAADVVVEGDVIIFNEELTAINVYSITGELIASKSNSNKITVVQSGILIVTVQDQLGRIKVLKLIK